MNKYLTVAILLFIITVGITTYIIFNNKSKQITGETFYATIESINNNNVLVNGLEVNDINYRSKFSFNINESTILEWRYTKINISDFKIGDKVSITFTGAILESYPAQLTNVIKMQLLEDEISKIKEKDFTIIGETEECDTALEYFYEDDIFKYYFNCIRSETTFVKFKDGRQYTIKEALKQNIVAIKEIEEAIKDIDKNIIYKQSK